MPQWVPIDTLIQQPTHAPSGTPSLPHPPAWHERAACNAQDPAIWFGTEARPHLYEDDITLARSICDPCQAFNDCLKHALTHREEHGIWAGTTSRERQRIRAAIQEGRTTLQEALQAHAEGHRPWRALHEHDVG